MAILLAYLLPEATVYLVENKEESLKRAIKRVQRLGLKNCRFFQVSEYSYILTCSRSIWGHSTIYELN